MIVLGTVYAFYIHHTAHAAKYASYCTLTDKLYYYRVPMTDVPLHLIGLCRALPQTGLLSGEAEGQTRRKGEKM